MSRRFYKPDSTEAKAHRRSMLALRTRLEINAVRFATILRVTRQWLLNRERGLTAWHPDEISRARKVLCRHIAGNQAKFVSVYREIFGEEKSVKTALIAALNAADS